MTAILGISAFYHDSAAAIIVDGTVVAAAQEERFSRIKHDPSFPRQAIEFCLRQAGIEIEDLDHVVFYEKPFLKFERILETYLHAAPNGHKSFTTAMPVWLKSKLYLSRVISTGLDKRYRKRIIFPEHHESHAASAFFPSPFEQAAILTVDGVGEWATTTLGVGNGNQIELIKELVFPDSLGLLYSAFTSFCGFHVNGGEGKLMGLAPYGDPVYVDLILDKLIDLKADGSFRLDQQFFDYCTGTTMTSPRFDNLLAGPPRKPESTITKREQDLAASIQSVTETVMLKIAEHLHGVTGMKNLCIAGGVGLNCVANGRLLREGPFENVWVQPAAGDSGGAIGAALFAWHQLLDQPRTAAEMETPFLGSGLDQDLAKSYFDESGARYREFATDGELFDEVAELLAAQKIIGWFQGRMEFGPRALGNRSILADPRGIDTQDQLNKKVKFREPFRPFAPVVLADQCEQYFAMDRPSPYMLFAGSVRAEHFDAAGDSQLPAITHVAGSARIQTVTNSDNPKLHGLLKQFAARTQCPMLVNTSLNVRGEPIVCTVADAYQCLMETDLDVLVVGNLVLKKSEQTMPFRNIEPVKTPISTWQKLLLSWNAVTYPIRWLLSKTVLTLIFLFIVTPIGLIARAFGTGSFQPIDRETNSYWRTRKPTSEKSRYFKQY